MFWLNCAQKIIVVWMWSVSARLLGVIRGCHSQEKWLQHSRSLKTRAAHTRCLLSPLHSLTHLKTLTRSLCEVHDYFIIHSLLTQSLTNSLRCSDTSGVLTCRKWERNGFENKPRNTAETPSNTKFCLCDVSASCTQEEIITHRMLLCNSPQECIPSCTAKQHAPALMKESRAKCFGEAATAWRKCTASSERFLYKAPAARFYERTEMPTTQRRACSLNAALCILAPTHGPYHFTPQTRVTTHSTQTTTLHMI